MSSTPTGDATNHYDDAALSDSAADDAFLKSFAIEPDDEDKDAVKPSKEVETTTDDDAAKDGEAEDKNSDESPEGEAEGDDDKATEQEADEDKDDKRSYVDSDETYVKVKIGDEEKEVSVKDLKRLYGQEASLTRKSQEVADQRKLADTQAATHVAALNVMLEKAKTRAAPYAALDWLAISKNPDISAADASALRDEAQAALADVTFFEGDLGNLMTTISEKTKADNAAQAKVCISALSTPGTAEKPNALHIEGWNDKVYDDLRSFARELGADANSINALVDPVSFKVLHMAMLFQKGASKVLTVKTKKSPTKIVKTSSSSPASKGPASQTARTKAVSNLRRTGSEEHAEDAFMASMADKD